MKSLSCNGCITQMLGVICQPGLSRRARSALQGKELDTVLSLFTLLPPPCTQWRGMQISPLLPILAPFTCPPLSQRAIWTTATILFSLLPSSSFSMECHQQKAIIFIVAAFIMTGMNLSFGPNFCFRRFPLLVHLKLFCLRSVPQSPAKSECGNHPSRPSLALH